MRILLLSDSTTSGAGKAIKNIALLLSKSSTFSVSTFTYKNLPVNLRLINKIFARIEMMWREFFLIGSNIFSILSINL